MRFIQKNDAKFRGETHEERVAVLIGRHPSHGASKLQTVAIVELFPGVRSSAHFHKEREESYFILEGHGKALIAGQEVMVQAGDCLFAEPNETHQFVSEGKVPLRYLVLTTPAWMPEDSHS